MGVSVSFGEKDCDLPLRTRTRAMSSNAPDTCAITFITVTSKHHSVRPHCDIGPPQTPRSAYILAYTTNFTLVRHAVRGTRYAIPDTRSPQKYDRPPATNSANAHPNRHLAPLAIITPKNNSKSKLISKTISLF